MIQTKANAPEFPQDLPWEERAIILDKNVIELCDYERLLDGRLLYSTKEFVKKVDKSLAALLHGIRGHTKRDSGSDRKTTDRGYEHLINIISNLGTNVPKKVSRLELFRNIRYCNSFMSEDGMVVDEYDKNCVIAQRMKAYLPLVKQLRPLVPKAYIADTIGSPGEPLSEKLVQQVMDGYNKVLLEYDSENKLGTRARNRFRENLAYFCTEGYESVNTSTIKEDFSMVALACSIPAKDVLIYSHDTDIIALGITANQLLDLENHVRVEKSSPQQRQPLYRVAA